MRLLFLFSILLIAGLSCYAQVTPENRVFIEQSFGAKDQGCSLRNSIVGADELEKLRSDPDCAGMLLPDEIDFSTKTLITYRMSGDCRISGSADISRDPMAKKYTVYLKNYWGRCRAGGSFVGWILIQKIVEGFTIEFNEALLEQRPINEKPDELAASTPET